MKKMARVTMLGVMLLAGLQAAQAQDSFGRGQQRQTQPPNSPPQQPGYPPQQPGYPQQPNYPQQPGYPQQPNYPQQPSYPQQPGNPQQPNYPPPQSGYPPGAQPGAGRAMDQEQLAKMERQDFGVPATRQLHDGAMHSPTPGSIPGGQLITTKGLVDLVQGRKAPYFLFDVLGGPEILPGAIPSMWMAQPGTFNDPTQQQFAQVMQQGTQGRKDTTLVFYCLSNNCWMSYNAALRAINAGYTNVRWYRGGIEAWKAAGLPTQPAQPGPPPQQGGYGPPQPGGYPPPQSPRYAP